MAVDEKKLAEAKEVYKALCQFLDEDGWKYDKNEEDLVITSGASGEDLPIQFMVKVDAERGVIRTLSRMPLSVPEDKRLDMAIAVSIINNKLIEGCFEFNIANESIIFSMINCFAGATLGKGAFAHIIIRFCKTVDMYNDKLLMLAKGLVTLEQFIESENK